MLFPHQSVTELQRSLLDDNESKENDILLEQVVITLPENQALTSHHNAESSSTIGSVHLGEIEKQFQRLSQDIPTAVNALEQNISYTRECRCVLGCGCCYTTGATLFAICCGFVLAQGIQQSDNTAIVVGSAGVVIGALSAILAIASYCKLKREGRYIFNGNREELNSHLSESDVAITQTTLNNLGRADIQINEQADGYEIKQASFAIAQEKNRISDGLVYIRKMKSTFFQTADEFHIPMVVSQMIVDYASPDPIRRIKMGHALMAPT